MTRSTLVLLLGAAMVWPACRGQKSSYCAENMDWDQGKSEPDKTVWCRSSDRRTAQFVELHRDGKAKRQSCTYVDGKAEGSFTAWHPNGRTWVAGQFSQGRPVGHWTQWDKAEAKVAEGDYRDGRFIAGAPVAGIALCERQKP